MLGGKRIYLVEDSPINAAIVRRILEPTGAIVIKDHWGFYALENIIEALPIDLILLDLMLPCGMSGYEIFDKLKKNEKVATIPVVIVSASDPNLEMKKARDKGFNGFIQKPIDQATFPRMLLAVLAGKTVWADDFI